MVPLLSSELEFGGMRERAEEPQVTSARKMKEGRERGREKHLAPLTRK